MCRVDVVCPPFRILMNSWLSKEFIHEVHSFCNHDSLHVSCVSVLQGYQASKRIRVWLKLPEGPKECVRHLLDDARYSLPSGGDIAWIEFGIA